MMLASNLIAWTRNFLKMGGMEDAFFGTVANSRW
uniref:Uncharacterized protein n=1 Tax=Klebsiella pneumoniae subsp. pneumoniae TaxID=72407 RepID=A0A343IRD8_KLEPN|nr:hypothetical protein EBPLCOIM_00109 [Klebsiella pneumoniae subsp. pneumoniae]